MFLTKEASMTLSSRKFLMSFKRSVLPDMMARMVTGTELNGSKILFLFWRELDVLSRNW